jgi:Family of unknown function (DUF6982)
MHRIVTRFQDGRVLKGFTTDFLPAKDHFHMVLEDQSGGAKPMDIHVPELKALFFVKSFAGDASHHRSNEPAPGARVMGRRIRVVFNDGEVMVGTTQGYDRSRPGFFLVPLDLDAGGNNERCFVVVSATKEVGFV